MGRESPEAERQRHFKARRGGVWHIEEVLREYGEEMPDEAVEELEEAAEKLRPATDREGK